LVPLAQDVLNVLIADKAKMQTFIKKRFQHRGTHEELSDTDVRDLAWAAMIRLEKGAFLYKLGRACAMMSDCSPDVYAVPRLHYLVADIHAALRSPRDQAGTAVPT